MITHSQDQICLGYRVVSVEGSGYLLSPVPSFFPIPVAGIFELGDHVRRAWPRLQRMHNLKLTLHYALKLKN